jgi:hypothetical protein
MSALAPPSVTVLRARDGKLMAKRFTGPSYAVTEYDEAFEFHYLDLEELAPNNVEELSDVLTTLESDPHAVIIRGVLADGIDPDFPVLRRIKAKGGYPIYFVEREDGRWALIDFDKLTPPDDKVTDEQRIDWLISLLPVEFHDVSFHYQMSSSARLPGKTTISAHVFFWLATPRKDSAMKEWAEWINRQHLLRPDVAAEAVKKPKLVDPAVFVSNQANYVAAPVFDEGAIDPYAGGGRSGFVRRAHDVVEVVMPPDDEVARLDDIERELQRQHYQGRTAPGAALPIGTTYAEKLAAIGAPSFNRSIMAAISTAVLLHGNRLDVDTVKREIRACVDANYVHARSGEMERYKSNEYLDEAIDSAITRFGRTDMERLRDRLVFQKRMREEARQRDAVPPFVDDESRVIEFTFLDDPCGSGKSFQFRDLIVKGAERHWLYAVDKIERIDEVIAELRGHYWRAGGIEVHDAYSGKCDDDGNLETVIGQLAGIRHKIDSRVVRDGNYHSVTFVTHAALLMYPWHERGWDDHALICDEKPGIWFCDVMDDVSSNFAILERYFQIERREGDRIHLGLTDLGRRVGESTKPDVFDRRIWPLLNLACRGRHVWANRSGWDSRGGERIDFYALTLPDAFAGFRQRWMAADNLSQSLLYRLWERRGVAWSKVSLPGGRQRSTPLHERGAVFYFMRHGASFTRFTQPDRPALGAARYVAAQHDRVLYTVNNRKFAEAIHDAFAGDPSASASGHLYVTPKQTGTERYKNFNVAFWGAAIQASQTESDLIWRETGMTRRELDLDREFDALNQFAFRTIARDYDSDEPFVIYVMSQAQAEYLAKRYDLAIAHVPDVVIEHEPEKGGRPPTVGIKAMSPEEKRAYKAQKQRESRGRAKANM